MCPKCRDEGWVPAPDQRGRWCPIEKVFMHRPGRPQQKGIETYEMGQEVKLPVALGLGALATIGGSSAFTTPGLAWASQGMMRGPGNGVVPAVVALVLREMMP